MESNLVISLKLALVIGSLLFALAVNIFAVVYAKKGKTRLHVCARFSGITGIVFFFMFLIAFFDLFSQIWVSRPGYTGWPVGITVILFALTSTIAFIILIVLKLRTSNRRDTRT